LKVVFQFPEQSFVLKWAVAPHFQSEEQVLPS